MGNVPALIRAIQRLAILRWLGAAFCALAMLCATVATASALEPAQTKTRVWDFELTGHHSLELSSPASPRTRPAFSPVSSEQASASPHAAEGVANEIPSTLARVIPGEGPFPTLGPPSRADVFVTAAEDIAGMTPEQIAQRLTISPSSSFTIIEFETPAEGLASPVLRSDPGFIGGGRTLGGAREFILPNGPVPAGATVRLVR
jgi:hypothetical protein